MALATTQAVWRSGGGDQTRTAYCGSMKMAAGFYIPNVAAASTTNVQVTSTNTSPVILPANAVITGIGIAATTSTGGSSPTIDIGFTTYTSGVSTANGIGDEIPSDGLGYITLATSTAGDNFGLPLSTSEMSYITAGAGSSAASSGAITGFIEYYIADNGQQNV